MQDLSQAVRFAIQEIAVGPDRSRDISAEIAEQVLHGILEGKVDEVQSAVFLIALRMKHESIDEMIGLTRAAQSLVPVQTVNVDELVTLVDPFDGYSRTLTVSAFIPCVLAAMGFATLMHGVNSVGPKFGVTAQQVLTLAGVYSDQADNQPLERAVNEVQARGWAYINQAHYAPALHRLVSLRNKIVKRTALTTLERVLRPMQSKGLNHLALGYVHKAYPEIYAAIARAAGHHKIHLSKGVEGGLMVAMNKPFARYSADLRSSELQLVSARFEVSNEAEGVPKFAAEHAADSQTSSDHSQACLQAGLEVLAGKPSLARESLIAAAANIACSVHPELHYKEAVEKAAGCIDNGSAREHFYTGSL